MWCVCMSEPPHAAAVSCDSVRRRPYVDHRRLSMVSILEMKFPDTPHSLSALLTTVPIQSEKQMVIY